MAQAQNFKYCGYNQNCCWNFGKTVSRLSLIFGRKFGALDSFGIILVFWWNFVHVIPTSGYSGFKEEVKSSFLYLICWKKIEWRNRRNQKDNKDNRLSSTWFFWHASTRRKNQNPHDMLDKFYPTLERVAKLGLGKSTPVGFCYNC